MQSRCGPSFPAFFAIASPRQAQIMDAAYVGTNGFRQAVATPRPRPDDPVRHSLEVVTNNAAQLLMHVRGALRRSDAYRTLPEGKRTRIDRPAVRVGIGA
jgi:hypothetical protein